MKKRGENLRPLLGTGSDRSVLWQNRAAVDGAGPDPMPTHGCWSKKVGRRAAYKPRRRMICPKYRLSIRRQCELLSINRASYYYSPRQEKAENLQMMLLMNHKPHQGISRNKPVQLFKMAA